MAALAEHQGATIAREDVTVPAGVQAGRLAHGDLFALLRAAPQRELPA